MSIEDKIRRRITEDPTVQEILREIHEAELEGEYQRAVADPEAHKLTLVMQRGKPATYRLYRGGGVAGKIVCYGYTCWRNAAGYFLSFREVEDPETGTIRRDKWVAHKKRRVAAETAERWALDSREGASDG